MGATAGHNLYTLSFCFFVVDVVAVVCLFENFTHAYDVFEETDPSFLLPQCLHSVTTFPSQLHTLCFIYLFFKATQSNLYCLDVLGYRTIYRSIGGF